MRAELMCGDGFRETGQPMRLLAGCFYGVLRDWPIIVNAREQPLLRANGDPVAAQDLQQHGRRHHVLIFATFTLLDANNHTGTIDGGGLQPDGPPKCASLPRSTWSGSPDVCCNPRS